MSDLAIASSIIGLGVTVFLFFEARAIKNSFLRRARLPEVLEELVQANRKISKHLKNWEAEYREGLEQFSIAKSLLDNVQQKLPEPEKKKVAVYLRSLETRKFWVLKKPIITATEDEAWELYTGLSGLITSLKQLQKDSKWD
ncbi:hypothetical protein [Nitrosomonas marina]|uniref:Uncharacterized protein n=1 Tax=Nitrosomonas marina TaxID=917 RepID=A0A1H8FW38_9PROT|nr:hypothetical protein [Nitrosomonas marina]SEN35734.1 hypothetical protein SAMN05216325_1151 [Nitrosomonas marina]